MKNSQTLASYLIGTLLRSDLGRERNRNGVFYGVRDASNILP